MNVAKIIFINSRKLEFFPSFIVSYSLDTPYLEYPGFPCLQEKREIDNASPNIGG